MLTLLQADQGAPTLINLVREQTARAGLRGRHCGVYAITCYIDFPAAFELARVASKALRAAGATLGKFTLLYDVREWAKQRSTTEANTRAALQRILKLDGDNVVVDPVSFPNQLMHSKAYAVVTRRPQEKGKRTGFVITTSGNLTQRGLGLDSDNNVELAHVSRETEDLDSIVNVAKRLRQSVVSAQQRLRQDTFLFAIRLLSSGDFYHRWSGNLKSEVRFRLQLSEAGKKLGAQARGIFRDRGYEGDTESVSSDPLRMERVFSRIPKPLPPEFIRMFTVDTVLGRWMPAEISELVKVRLDRDAEPYLNEVRRLTAPGSLRACIAKLREDVAELRSARVIEGAGDVVDSWEEKVRRLRENDALVKRIVFSLERLEEPLAEMDRTLIVQTYESLQGSVEVKGPRGTLKRTLARAMRQFPEDCVGLFHELTDEAREHLQ
jgi:hypothetical protein